jgi:hypothetical protein
MRRIFGLVAVAIGGFLLIAAVLGTFWAPGVVKKTPLDVDTTTRLEGEAAKLDTETGDFTKRPVWVKSVSQVDSNTSTDDTAYWVSVSCVQFDEGQPQECAEDVEDPRQITLDVDAFGTDRVTAMSKSDNLPQGVTPHEGVVNKFPFDTEKKDYPYWDGTVGRAVDAKYVGEEQIKGIDTYKFEVKLVDEPIEIGEGIEGTYTDTKTIYIEPKTGAIQHQVDDQQRYLTDGTQVLDLQIRFTDEQIQTFADDAESNMGRLTLITRTIPVIGFSGGVLFLLVGLVLLRGRREEAEPVSQHKETVGAGH